MKKTPSRRQYSQVLAATLLSAMLASNAAYAANDLWIGNTDANFNTLANWTGSVTPNGNTPQFGTAGSSGTTLNNDQTGSSFAGLLFNSGASAYTIGGNSFTLTADITNNSSSLQTINNAIVLSNTSHTFTTTNASGGITLGGAFSGFTQTVNFVGPGTTTLSGTNTFNTGGSNFGALVVGGTITSGASTGGNVSITGATTTDGSGGTSTNGGSLDIHGNSNLTIQTGGSLTINAVANVAGNSIIGQNSTGTSTLLVNGGSLTVSGAQGFAIGNNRADATGVLTISSGTATITAGSATLQNALNFIAMGRDNATGIINLDGGTLATGRQFVRDGSSGGTAGLGTATFNFNGGTLKSLANQTSGNGWFETVNTGNFRSVTTIVKSGGAKIDTNGFNTTINTVLAHDSSLGGTLDGGLTKSGLGTLTLGAANTYTGATTINAGTLTLGANAAVATFLADMSDLYLTTGSLLNLSFTTNSVMESISGLYIDGVQQLAGTWGAINSGATFESALITGTGLLNVTSAIPEPSTYAALAGVLALGAVITRRRSRQA